MMERATELEFLQWFYSWADFGPADSDVRDCLLKEFVDTTGKALPVGYEPESWA